LFVSEFDPVASAAASTPVTTPIKRTASKSRTGAVTPRKGATEDYNLDVIADPGLAAILNQHQTEFVADVEARIKAAQAVFLKKLNADIQQYLADK